MKRITPKPLIIGIAIGLLLLKYPMSKSIELANWYSVIVSIAISAFLVCLIVWDSWNDSHIKNESHLNQLSLCKYRALSALIVLLVVLEEILVLSRIKRPSMIAIQTMLLIGAFVALWVRGRYAQGTQTKFKTKEMAIYFVLILLICGLSYFLRSALA